LPSSQRTAKLRRGTNSLRSSVGKIPVSQKRGLENEPKPFKRVGLGEKKIMSEGDTSRKKKRNFSTVHQFFVERSRRMTGDRSFRGGGKASNITGENGAL